MSNLLSTGYLSTSGSQIVDASGRSVRIASVGWNQGFNSIATSVQQMVAFGFNCTRVSWVNATMQADLQRIDQIVAAAGKVGLKVIIDHHTDEAGTPADGWGAQQRNGLWYDVGGASDGTNAAGVKGTVSQLKFVSDWVSVAQHYAVNDTVIGFDLTNEPLVFPGACTWGDGDPNHDIRMMYMETGNAILAVNPNALIICAGPMNYGGNFAGTGHPAPWGDLSLAVSKPVVLSDPKKLVYTVHDYPNYVSGVSPDSGPQKIAAMNAAWGHLVSNGIAPVWIGEMGANFDGSYSNEDVAASTAWAQTLTDYMNGRLGSQGGPTFSDNNHQPVPGNWWAWGCLNGQQLNGTMDSSGQPRTAQQKWWSQLFPVSSSSAAPASTPTPPPRPPVQASPNNTVILAGKSGSITDAAGNKWTIANGQVGVNGTVDTTTKNVAALAYVGGTIWQENTSNLWWSKASPISAWTPTAGTSISPLPPNLTPPTAPTLPTPSGPVTSGTWVQQTINGMKYDVLPPDNYSKSVKYPVVLYLHELGMGVDEPALMKQVNPWFNSAAFRTAYPAIVVMPLLDQRADPSGNTVNFGGVTATDNIGETNAIAALKQVLATYSVDTSRIYVTGNSLGGMGTWDMLVKFNAYTGTEGKIFAAGLPLAGADYGQGYPTPKPAVVQALKPVPIWAIHGGRDATVPLAWDQHISVALQAAGGANMKLTVDPNLSHDVWDTYYTQTGPQSPLAWLFGQKVSLTTTPAPPPSQPSGPSGPSITDANGHVWSIAGGQVIVDGKADMTTANVVNISYVGGKLWQENAASLWRYKTKPTDSWTSGPVPFASEMAPTLIITPPSTGKSLILTGSDATIVGTDGLVVTFASIGTATITLGSAPVSVAEVAMSSVQVQGGASSGKMTAGPGTMAVVGGSSSLEVVGGPDPVSYQYGPGDGLLTIDNFSPAKGDVLVIQSALKSVMAVMPDGKGGTKLTFDKSAAGIEIENIKPADVSAAIKWN